MTWQFWKLSDKCKIFASLYNCRGCLINKYMSYELCQFWYLAQSTYLWDTLYDRAMEKCRCSRLRFQHHLLIIVKWCSDNLWKWHGSYQNKKTHFCRTIVQLCVCTKKKKANVLGLQISTSYLKLWSDVQIVFANDMADFENEKANAKYFLRTPVNCNYSKPLR